MIKDLVILRHKTTATLTKNMQIFLKQQQNDMKPKKSNIEITRNNNNKQTLFLTKENKWKDFSQLDQNLLETLKVMKAGKEVKLIAQWTIF